MEKFADIMQSADFKNEKHVPVIECSDTAQADKNFEIRVTVGKEIPHPNTTEHHIVWISLYFLPEGEKFPFEIGDYVFSAHGATTQGPNTGTAYTEPSLVTTVKFKKPGNGTLLASSYCNIHGLWEGSRQIKVAG